MTNIIHSVVLSSLNEIHTEHGIKFLVIDQVVDNLLSYLFVDRNVLLSHVAAIERIDSNSRIGQPSVDVIYFVKPTKLNINYVEADFCNRPARYKRHHIRFLPGLTEELACFLKSKRNVSQNMVSLGEIKCGFVPKEQQYFETIGIDQPLQIFFNSSCTDLIQKSIEKAVQSLLNVCIITGEYPIIRYSEPSQETVSLTRAPCLPKKLAFEFQNALDDYARHHEDFPPVTTRPRSVLIITDRSLDLFSPLVHSFTYQAMAYDLVNQVDPTTHTYSYEAENERGEMEPKTSKLLDLLDPDWIELKHQHIADASEYLNNKINEIIANNPLLVDRSKVKTTTDLLSVVAHLKDFDEVRRRITLHRTLIDKCLEISNTRNLVESSEIEQVFCGFGLDFEGNKVKKLADSLIESLNFEKPLLTDKIRFILEYSLEKGGLCESDFVKLLNFIGVEPKNSNFKSFMQLFTNFKYLGFKLVKSSLKDSAFKKEWTHRTIMDQPDIYQTSRFVPSISYLLSTVIDNPLLLNEEQFPYVKDKPIELLNFGTKVPLASTNSVTSLRNPRLRASWAKNNTHDNLPKQRVFYYIIGGVTHVELKAACSLGHSRNKDVFIGSDFLLTPLLFIEGVGKLSKGRDQLNLKEDLPVLDEPPSFFKPSNVFLSDVPHHESFSQTSPASQNVQTHNTRPSHSSQAFQASKSNIARQLSGSTISTFDDSEHSDKQKDKIRHKFTKFLRK